MKDEDIKKELEKRSNFIDMIYEMIGDNEYAPIEMQIMKADREITKTYQEIMETDNFLQLGTFEEEKEILLNFLKQEQEILSDLLEKVRNKGE